MQRDSSTYCDEPEDRADFDAWLQSFDLQANRPDIDAIIASNAFMAELQSRIVPLIVEYETFWTRYFYRYHCLLMKHEARLQVAQRASQMHGEEVGWDDDDAAVSGLPAEHLPGKQQLECEVATTARAAAPVRAELASVSEELSPGMHWGLVLWENVHLLRNGHVDCCYAMQGLRPRLKKGSQVCSHSSMLRRSHRSRRAALVAAAAELSPGALSAPLTSRPKRVFNLCRRLPPSALRSPAPLAMRCSLQRQLLRLPSCH